MNAADAYVRFFEDLPANRILQALSWLDEACDS